MNQNHFPMHGKVQALSGMDDRRDEFIDLDRLVGMVNAYYFVGCIGPETGTNIGAVLDYVKTTRYKGFSLI